MKRTLVSLSLGAIAGALSRYYLGLWLLQVLPTPAPYSTMVINLSGCLVMGFLGTLFLEERFRVHPDLRLFLTTGFLGSYTTFSSYELDTLKLWQSGAWELQLLYWLGSILLGLWCLQIGIALAEVFWRFYQKP